MAHRYYSTQRPIVMGTIPSKDCTVTNFEDKTYCEDIGRDAWGYVEYDAPLSARDVLDYELKPAVSVAMTEEEYLAATDNYSQQ